MNILITTFTIVLRKDGNDKQRFDMVIRQRILMKYCGCTRETRGYDQLGDSKIECTHK